MRNSIGVALEISVASLGTSSEGEFLSYLIEIFLDLFILSEFGLELIVVLNSGITGVQINEELDSCLAGVHGFISSCIDQIFLTLILEVRELPKRPRNNA